jgi:glycosyltransferase 2 family protein
LRRRAWTATRLLGAALVLAFIVRRVGAEPFLDGLRGLGPGTLLAALAIGAGTTVCSAWRWRTVAAALGMELPLPGATAAYYRSQFLNCALPGGVLGDVDRSVRQGAEVGDLGRAVRAVVGERVAGQLVQAAVAVVVLLALPSPVHAAMPAVVSAGALVAVTVLLARRGLARRRPTRTPGALRTPAAEIRDALLQPATWPIVLLASLLVVGTYVGMFLLAARAAGVHQPTLALLPAVLIVLMGAAVPLNVAGWGPREGVAVWVFAASGWGAATGAAVATAFGVLVLVATLPGAAVLLANWLRPRVRDARTAAREQVAVVSAGVSVGVARSRAREDGAVHG